MQKSTRYAAFSGCDSTSQFVGCGKKTVVKLLTNDATLCEAKSLLGNEFIPTVNTLEQADQAICTLYNSPQCTNTNDVHNLNWN